MTHLVPTFAPFQSNSKRTDFNSPQRGNYEVSVCTSGATTGTGRRAKHHFTMVAVNSTFPSSPFQPFKHCSMALCERKREDKEGFLGPRSAEITSVLLWRYSRKKGGKNGGCQKQHDCNEDGCMWMSFPPVTVLLAVADMARAHFCTPVCNIYCYTYVLSVLREHLI